MNQFDQDDGSGEGRGGSSRRRPLEDRPVLSGIIALLSVGLVIGLIFGGGALAATRVLGIGEDGAGGGASTARETAVIPQPERTDPETGPALSLPPDTDAPSRDLPSTEDEEEDEEDGELTLSAAQSAVGASEPIDLTGTYPGGAGVTLQIQRLTDGEWADFPVDVTVNDDETFTTFILTSQTGETQFRVYDVDADVASEPVTVQIG